MKIAIHHREGSYSTDWIRYCREHNLDFKVVNAYDTDIVDQISDCDAFMWHHHHYNYKDKLFAKEFLFSLEQCGKVVFPNFKTGWHFDDKLGQKYLFETHGVQYARAWAFYDKQTAFEWIDHHSSFPLVYKLRRGASASNVFLVHNKKQAKRIVKYAFSGSLWHNPAFWLRKSSERITNIVEGLGRRLFPQFSGSRFFPDEIGYVYFQEFIPNDGYDYRLEIVGDKCIATLRYNRKGDFRASGGHDNHYDKELFPKELFSYGFKVHRVLGLQSSSLDIVRHKDTKEFYLIENSYCYGADPDEYDHGYWTEDGMHHDEPFNGLDWMIELVVKECESRHPVDSI